MPYDPRGKYMTHAEQSIYGASRENKYEKQNRRDADKAYARMTPTIYQPEPEKEIIYTGWCSITEENFSCEDVSCQGINSCIWLCCFPILATQFAIKGCPECK